MISSITKLYDTNDPPNEIGVEITGIGRQVLPSGELGFRVLYADIPGGSWNPQRVAKFAERVQELIDFRQPIADLPSDDPDKTVDPARPSLFWDGNDLVSRSVLISDVSWNVEAQRLYFSMSTVF